MMLPPLRHSWSSTAALLLLLLLLLAGCSSPPDSDGSSAAERSPTTPATPDQSSAAPAPGAEDTSAPPPAESPGGAPAAEPSSPSPAGAADVVDPGGAVAVTATKEGLHAVGPDKCKLCHKVQFDSWSASAHARRTPPLDCEACHGPGSEYRTMAVMKDPERARAAGLVIPTADFCGRCHRTWSDDMLAKAHAHKSAGG